MTNTTSPGGFSTGVAASFLASAKPLGAIKLRVPVQLRGKDTGNLCLTNPAAMPGGLSFTELRSKAPGNISFYPGQWVGQEQALPLRWLKNNESSFAAGTMSWSTKEKKNILLKCFEIVSDVGVKDSSFMLNACNYMGLCCRWANSLAQKWFTFPNGDSLEFPIPWKKKKKKVIFWFSVFIQKENTQ